ncbi:hypothetical protein BHECKSOX_2108 [Bathymodiolus heckerae thiotrophic gill symbiont]|nr:hypothetical protein BHECKSOX_2108 [Bathymodiolus heckerae thiotrophic gill symbiont]
MNMKNLKNCVDVIQYYESLEDREMTFCNFEKKYMSTLPKEGDSFILSTGESLR